MPFNFIKIIKVFKFLKAFNIIKGVKIYFNYFLNNKKCKSNFKWPDFWKYSLCYTNNLLNQKYGETPRKVLPHIPLLIDKQIMNYLQEAFSDDFLRTSSNRFRSKNDMQFAFSYFHFIINEFKKLSPQDKHFGDFNQNKNSKLIEFKFELPKTGEIIWRNIGIGGGSDDQKQIKLKLDNLVKESPKFVCLNDVVDYNVKQRWIEIKKIQKEFYSNLFPIESSFEKHLNKY
jgi:hypothetical protein